MKYHIWSIAVILTVISFLLIGCKADKVRETVIIETTAEITESTEAKSKAETVPEFDTVVMFDDVTNVSEAFTEEKTITDELGLNNDSSEKKMESEIIVENPKETIQESDTIVEYVPASDVENMGDLVP